MAQNPFLAQYHSETVSLDPQDSRSSENLFPHDTTLEMQPLQDQCFLEETDPSLNIDEASYLLNVCTTRPRSQLEWAELHQPDCNYSMKNDYYDLAAPSIEDPQGPFGSRGFFHDTACPRTWAQPYDLRPPWSFDLEDCAAPGYLVHPPRDTYMETMTDGHTIDRAADRNSREFSHLSISRSPTMESLVVTPAALDHTPTLADVLSSKASECGDDEGAEGSQSAPDERISDEPYAKLIYRALLGAQDHRMALQEIYQWFIENTDKGSLTSSGWRNSIRHNLSMNAAFRKTDRCLTADDSKKSSEWVLEPFAIKNGVTPTTRYRKNGKKAIRSENPDPVRVISGRKGGQQAGKTKSSKQRFRDEQNDIMRGSAREGRRRQSQTRHQMTPAANLRQLSPSTPTAQEMPNHGPYYTKYPLCDGLSSCDGLPSLSDVHGVFIEEEPLFYPNEQIHFGDHYPNVWANSH